MLNSLENNFLIAIWSVLVFVYYQILTFALGFSCRPKKARLYGENYWNYFIAWIIGFSLLTCTMVIIGTFWRINWLSLLLSNVAFWFIILSSSYHFKLPSLKIPRLEKTQTLILFLLVVIITLMFFSCLVPPTKIDELKYHLFYVKLAVLEEGFKLHYSPYHMLMHMGIQTYNIWSYALKAEYTPALNSFFCYLFSIFILFFWTKERYNKTISYIAVLITAFSLIKVTEGIAPGDNIANHLFLMTFMMLSYDIYSNLKKQTRSSTNLDKLTLTKLFALNLVFCLSIVIKITSILMVIPTFLLLYIFILKKVNIERKQLLQLALPFIVLIPFLLRAYVLYGNPLFPLTLNLFGAGPFDSSALKNYFNANTTSWNFQDIIASPYWYIFDSSFTKVTNPLFWLFSFLGYIHLIRKKAIYIVIGIVISYILASYKLPANFFGYYMGVMDFLIVLGIVELFNLIPLQWKIFSENLVKVLTITTASIITLAIVVYTKQFLFCFFTNQNRDAFIKPRVECYETIQWINHNLPKDSLILVETKGRYYYERKTESLTPTVFGKAPKELERNLDEAYKFLKQKGVTHLLVCESLDMEDFYYYFYNTKKYVEKVYKNNNEIVVGKRWTKPEYGKTAIYKLR